MSGGLAPLIYKGAPVKSDLQRPGLPAAALALGSTSPKKQIRERAWSQGVSGRDRSVWESLTEAAAIQPDVL